MAKGKTLWDGISGLIWFLILGPPTIVIILFIGIFPDFTFNHSGFVFVAFVILTITYWVFMGIGISKMIKSRQEKKHQRELELARAKGRAYRGED